eukprot:NODE_75_length_23955_cov_0.435069.p21 type:complete len:122 gc:universal NODE_75_length_23955_cov_0.435069:20223-19858(-)
MYPGIYYFKVNKYRQQIMFYFIAILIGIQVSITCTPDSDSTLDVTLNIGERNATIYKFEDQVYELQIKKKNWVKFQFSHKLEVTHDKNVLTRVSLEKKDDQYKPKRILKFNTKNKIPVTCS